MADMPRFGYSLLALFGFVTFTAMGCAALTNPTSAWLAAIVSHGMACILLAPVAAIYSREDTRAFLAGFAIVAWAYQFFFLIDTLGWRDINVNSLLPTSQLLEFLGDLEGLDYEHVKKDGESMQRLLYIGEMLWTILFGFVGGLVARYLYLRRERDVPKN